MILMGLKLFYNDQGQDVYNQIRTNVLDNMKNQFENTGFIWETYNWTTAQGQDNHPFTGWSTLALLMITEDYPWYDDSTEVATTTQSITS